MEPREIEGIDLVLKAIAYATRLHAGQVRKDKVTPYASHVIRVCFLVRDVFAVRDHRVLTAAVLHDTIEDTLTDFDDLEESFGTEVARWVSMLTKEKRLPYGEREQVYAEVLRNAPWQVQICKLADIYDNLLDSSSLPPHEIPRSISNKRSYLDAMQGNLKAEAQKAWELTDRLFDEIAGFPK